MPICLIAMVTFLASFWDGTHFLFFHTKKNTQAKPITDVCLALKVRMQRMIFFFLLFWANSRLWSRCLNAVSVRDNRDYCRVLTPCLTSSSERPSVRLSICMSASQPACLLLFRIVTLWRARSCVIKNFFSLWFLKFNNTSLFIIAHNIVTTCKRSYLC